ncbi:ABC transporter permease [uncultured Halomonas sp.]|uniref:ABC transporter permease n=1 Tax=uncultured Halomonas sp. TaxID=173971 RepID=UPI002622B9C0|nr:ABC transporter permease [uncultured Halomonas sp.]
MSQQLKTRESAPVAAPIAPKRPSRLRTFLDSDIVYSWQRQPVVILATLVTLVMFAGALFAPWIAPQNPFDPRQLELIDAFTPPLTTSDFTGNFYLLGSDSQGRDVFSAILYGSRISLLVGFAAVLFALALGTALGLLAGFRGGWRDALIMRIADVQLTFPSILMALLIFGVIRGFLPRSMHAEVAIIVLIVAIGLSDWVQYARAVRGATMVEKSKEYVQAARVIGLPDRRILFQHILPNVLRPVLVIGTIGLALAIIAEATLSFLGVGMPATQPSLGTLIRVGQDYMFSGEWWILLFPGVALLLLALSVNLLGDWLRDVLNPKLR